MRAFRLGADFYWLMLFAGTEVGTLPLSPSRFRSAGKWFGDLWCPEQGEPE